MGFLIEISTVITSFYVYIIVKKNANKVIQNSPKMNAWGINRKNKVSNLVLTKNSVLKVELGITDEIT